MTNRDKGRIGEDAALHYLEGLGFTLLERNYRALRAEIDLIMLDGDTTVFIEVKARSSKLYGLPREAVDHAKQRNMFRAASAYSLEHGILDAPLRFDVAEVELATLAVTHIRNAFSV